jgi:hypothetical protein
MSPNNEYQIPTQPSTEADMPEAHVSLHASKLMPLEQAAELNGARGDIENALKQRETLTHEERSRLIIGQVSTYMASVRKDALN